MADLHRNVVSVIVQALEIGLLQILRDFALRQLVLTAGFGHVDYVAIRRADDLAPFADGIVDGPARVLAAAWLGKTRLIDNMPV